VVLPSGPRWVTTTSSAYAASILVPPSEQMPRHRRERRRDLRPCAPAVCSGVRQTPTDVGAAADRQPAGRRVPRQVERGSGGRVADRDDRVGVAAGESNVEMWSPNMRPCDVFGIQDQVPRPAIWVAALQLVPPFTER
jgi:hypothetical protein